MVPVVTGGAAVAPLNPSGFPFSAVCATAGHVGITGYALHSHGTLRPSPLRACS